MRDHENNLIVIKIWYSLYRIYIEYICMSVWQRRIQHRRLPPCLKFFWGFVFVNFDCITRIYFNCSHHTMFTKCTLFSTLTTPASKQTPRTQEFYCAGTAPPILKFLDPPLVCSMFNRKWVLSFPKKFYQQTIGNTDECPVGSFWFDKAIER